MKFYPELLKIDEKSTKKLLNRRIKSAINRNGVRGGALV
jgi:hypothetical protein